MAKVLKNIEFTNGLYKKVKNNAIKSQFCLTSCKFKEEYRFLRTAANKMY